VRNVFDIDPVSIPDPYEQKAVTAMQATALAVHGDERAPHANEILINLSQGLGVAPTMTYEDLIFRNPLGREVYVMSGPEQAQSEAAFYVAHREIEGHLAETITALGTPTPDVSLPRLDSAVRRLANLHRHLGAEAFAEFRPFFTGLNGYAGPSGLFSAAIPTLDLLVHNGENVASEERERILHDLAAGLYPSHQSETLTDLLLNGSELALSATVASGVVERLNKFRRAHRGSVKKFVPEALESQAEGSGGIGDVAGYLASKMTVAETRSVQ
jgi:hypothetical protein